MQGMLSGTVIIPRTHQEPIAIVVLEAFVEPIMKGLIIFHKTQIHGKILLAIKVAIPQH